MVDEFNPASRDTTRQRILDAALTEFAEFGKAGARVDRIAAQADVNKAMIYYHFRSKDNLYDATVMDKIGSIASGIYKSIVKLDTLREIVGTVVGMHANLLAGNPALRKIILRELAEDESPLVDHISEGFRRSGVPDLLRRRLLVGIEEGHLRDVDIRQTAASLVSMSIGFFLMLPIMSRTLEIEDTEKMIMSRKEAIVDLFLNGVLSR